MQMTRKSKTIGDSYMDLRGSTVRLRSRFRPVKRAYRGKRWRNRCFKEPSSSES